MEVIDSWYPFILYSTRRSRCDIYRHPGLVKIAGLHPHAAVNVNESIKQH